MTRLLGYVKIYRGRIWVPNDVQKELQAEDGDMLIFTKIDSDIIVTKNEVE